MKYFTLNYNLPIASVRVIPRLRNRIENSQNRNSHSRYILKQVQNTRIDEFHKIII